MKKISKKFIFILILSVMLTAISTAGIVNSDAVADLSDLERPTGNIKSDVVPIPDTGEFTSIPSSRLPSSVDLSEDESFPCVGDQGELGSCTAWASTYYQFGYQVAAMNSWNSKNDNTKQFSPKWTYNLINYGEDDGSNLDDAYKLLQSQGAVRYSEFAPKGVKTESEYREWCLDTEAMKKALMYRVSDCCHLYFANTSARTPVESPNTICLNIMKSLLNSGNVLTFSTDMGIWDYQKLNNQYKTELNNQYVCVKQVNTDDKRSGHAMAIVGYDDNITYDLNGDGIIQDYERGAFKIVNSWGKDYKNDGFIWVLYDALNSKSNADIQNVTGRQPIFEDYAYYVITVDTYPLDLLSEVTITQSNRSIFDITLGTSSENKIEPDQGLGKYIDTMFYHGTGSVNFSGLSTTPMQATFVFDFGNLCASNIVRRNYYLTVEDSEGNTGMSTIIDEIKLIDKTGKIVVDDAERKVIKNEIKEYRYKIGMVGDVDNDGIVTITDATRLQKYFSGIVDCSKDDIAVSDVNNDGYTDITDVTEIQKYLAGMNNEFGNGHFSYIS